MQLNRMKTVALLTEVSELSKGKELPFEVYVTWEDIDSGEQLRSATVNSVLRAVSAREEEKVNCPHCGETCKTETGLARHYTVQHRNVTTKTEV